jgi:hypothetical protein
MIRVSLFQKLCSGPEQSLELYLELGINLATRFPLDTSLQHQGADTPKRLENIYISSSNVVLWLYR